LHNFLLFKNIWNKWRNSFELKEKVYFGDQLLKERVSLQIMRVREREREKILGNVSK